MKGKDTNSGLYLMKTKVKMKKRLEKKERRMKRKRRRIVSLNIIKSVKPLIVS